MGKSDELLEVGSDLGESDLTDLEKRYGDSEPTRPCGVCGATSWSLQAAGRGRQTWVCKTSMPTSAGGTGATFDWDHYRRSHHEKVSGDDRVISLIAEVRRRRASADHTGPLVALMRAAEQLKAWQDGDERRGDDLDAALDGIMCALRRVHEIGKDT